MLALDVNLLTTKLENQTLEENKVLVTTSAPSSTSITLINKESGLKLSESAQARLGATYQGKKLWTVALNKDDKTEDTQSTSQGAEGTSLYSPNKDGGLQHRVSYPGEQQDIELGAVERPKKRHCRSMTVPQETEINIPAAKSSWQPQGSGLWKPVGLHCPRPLSGGSTKWDVRSVQWTPPEYRYYEFSSLAYRKSDPGHVTPDDLLTPPESPVPRPNSVYSDGAISPFTGDPFLDYQNKLVFCASEGFRNRSLSVEDKISSAVMSGPVVSMPGVASSIPSSPHHRHRIPRCRSQPSFYDRKSGRRRRRDCRPTLNFNKMTETAYCRPKSSDLIHSPRKDQGHGSSFHNELENVMSLMPIASSPRDTEIPAMRQMASHKKTSPIHELETTERDQIMVAEEDGSPLNEPVKLLGDEDDMEIFAMTEELDLEQIENH